MADLQRVMGLVEKALDDFDNPSISAGAMLRTCLRIAKLRNDFPNILRLEMEAEDLTVGDRTARATRRAALGSHFDADEWDQLGSQAVKDYLTRRQISGGVFTAPLDALERQITVLEEQAGKATPPEGLTPIDLYHRSNELRKVQLGLTGEALKYHSARDRVRAFLHQFLVDAERELEFGQVNADIFERNREFVDAQMGRISASALEQFKSAYRRVREGDEESLSHALTSCRRILKSVADSVYPPPASPVVGRDGRERKLSDERYINRLIQFVAERIGKHGDGAVVQATLDGLGARLSALDGLASKGVHANVSAGEVDTCIIQTYLVIGDVLRIDQGSSALTSAERGSATQPG